MAEPGAGGLQQIPASCRRRGSMSMRRRKKLIRRSGERSAMCAIIRSLDGSVTLQLFRGTSLHLSPGQAAGLAALLVTPPCQEAKG